MARDPPCYNGLMELDIRNTNKPDETAEFVASIILEKLSSGKKALFFATGGSSISVCAKISEILKGKSCGNLTVMLTDERYVPSGHPDSNFFQLKAKGFDIPGAKIIPVLEGGSIEETAEKFAVHLEKELKNADYRIGIFGIGPDGHTAGILPGSPAASSEGLASFYKTPAFLRITMAPRAIEKLDQAVVFMQGEEKRGALENLKKEIEIAKQPAQILKKVPLLTIFTNCAL